MEVRSLDQIFKLNPAEVEWDLSFPCPACGEAMFPDDHTGRSYNLLEIRIEGRTVKETIIQCTRCECMIHLEVEGSTLGFPETIVLTRNNVHSDVLESCYSISYG